MSVNRRRFLFSTGLTLAGAAAAYNSVSDSAFAFERAATNDMSNWANVRAQFAVSPEYIHLSSFFLVSHPRPVREAIDKYRRELDENPLLAVEEEEFGNQFRIEKAVAEYVGGKPEEIALTDSTTMGLALVYHGLPLRAGQEILTTTHDHYSHHESIRLAATRAGASVKKISLFDDFKSISDAEIAGRVKTAITPKTRVVGVTWVHSSSGLKLPIRAIAAAVAEANKGRAEADRALLVVDGVHGFGVEDETVAQTGADFFVAGTHKWILGPRGTGIIWAKADRWKIMRPTIPSFSFGPYGAWMFGTELKGMEAAWITPGGFHSFELRWALPAAFEFHKQIGRKRVAGRIHALNDQAKEGLQKMKNVKLYTPLGSKLSAGLICFDVEGMKPETVVKKLLEKRVIASQSPYGISYARIAPSLLNTEEEIEKTLGYIRNLV
ncbi:MAG TPA: aminotransferase class V-fold PLP-dependent enzyme [Pyrinomonadaceae bacterium]|nr:aminotransferase class V-fold PLP-dependent enzyme [Pyrinomonadaceae bacterium]